MKKKNLYLLLFIFVASSALIAIDYYKIKILSGVRAYTNGESEYSKGQKDALLYLYAYIETSAPRYMTSFRTSLQVPIGDNMARNSMQHNSGDSTTTVDFLMGKNHPKDIPDMIWLFKTFQSTYMKTPIRLWSEAEPMINQLNAIGNDIDARIKKGSLTTAEKQAAVKKITAISGDLYRKESEFSQVLGDTAREINAYVFYVNTLCILIIISNIALYAILMVRRMTATNKKLEAINAEVVETNKELDTLVYSVSHDLRSPITSIQGLLHLLKEETEKEQINEYVDLIDTTIRKQDIFILEIIDFFKNKRSSLSFREFSLKALIEDVLANNKFTPLAKHITITENIALDMVCTDELRIKMILNNLVSNAIKYSDERKLKRTIAINTLKAGDEIVIEVTDNGIGIDKRHIDKIYNMFFVTNHDNKGTGLGLYILKQNMEKLKGRVEVHSELHVGTKFTVYIPVGC